MVANSKRRVTLEPGKTGEVPVIAAFSDLAWGVQKAGAVGLTMLGIPLHGADVAPRFCFADEFLTASFERGKVCEVRRLSLPEEAWSKRLERLAAVGVRVLLCGGFNRLYLPFAEHLGIEVISGLAGPAEQLIDAFLRDDLEPYRFLPCRGARWGRRGRGWARPSPAGELRDERES